MSKQLQNRSEKLQSLIRSSAQEALSQSMRQQIESSLKDDPSKSFLVVALALPADLLDIGGAKLSLIKATRYCKDKPVAVLAVDGGFIVGRFVVPEVSIDSYRLHFPPSYSS